MKENFIFIVFCFNVTEVQIGGWLVANINLLALEYTKK